ncbi:hypothetical protein [Micromonospora sp. IBHARD004]|uniref:hypothetical protein n=1 Tax=Micromonospora sp. IBHARD004 TaxID=3457764 RepID=UPI004057D077
MTAISEHGRALDLANAVQRMAVRYGEAIQDYANASTSRTHADERARLLRASHRRFRAIQRLTRALADLTGGTR